MTNILEILLLPMHQRILEKKLATSWQPVINSLVINHAFGKTWAKVLDTFSGDRQTRFPATADQTERSGPETLKLATSMCVSVKLVFSTITHQDFCETFQFFLPSLVSQAKLYFETKINPLTCILRLRLHFGSLVAYRALISGEFKDIQHNSASHITPQVIPFRSVMRGRFATGKNYCKWCHPRTDFFEKRGRSDPTRKNSL